MDDRLEPLRLRPFPVGTVRARGWLEKQLRAQADGLTGHLDEFWPSIQQSAWIGGRNEDLERGPYWLDGLIPLAALLRDEKLIAKAAHWINYILDHPQPDGWLGPRPVGTSDDDRDPWPSFVLIKALRSWHELTQDPRVVPALLRAMKALRAQVSRRRLVSWAAYRSADLIWGLHWLHEITGEGWLVEFGREVQAAGFDWIEHFARDRISPQKTSGGSLVDPAGVSHGVNVAMGLKQGAVVFRQSGAGDHLTVANLALSALDRWHGQVTGMFSCDEQLAGLSPSQGSELCAIVELMFSLEVMLAASGDPSHLDRWESLAFNALPAALDPTMWVHQYDQQVNQVRCAVTPHPRYTDNGPEANLFGLEPHFGCCTANFHQGWPKFVQHCWGLTGDGGVALLSLAPTRLDSQVHGRRVQLAVTGGYPFAEYAQVHATVEGSGPLPLHLRAPGWSSLMRVHFGASEIELSGGETRRVLLPPGRHRLEVILPMPVQLRPGPNRTATLSRGPVILALAVGEQWRTLRGESPRADWELHPTTPWRYGLALPAEKPVDHVRVQVQPPTGVPFSADQAPVRAQVPVRPLPGWRLWRGAAADPPTNVATAGEVQLAEFLPYACARLRIAALPLVPPGHTPLGPPAHATRECAQLDDGRSITFYEPTDD